MLCCDIGKEEKELIGVYKSITYSSQKIYIHMLGFYIDAMQVYYRNGRLLFCAYNDVQEEQVINLYVTVFKGGITNSKLISGNRAREIEPSLAKTLTLVLCITNIGVDNVIMQY